MTHEHHEAPGSARAVAALVRVPGLFRRWELGQVLAPGVDFHLEEAGAASDGTPLFAVFRRVRPDRKEQ